MTLDEARRRVAEIEALQDDCEAASGKERNLWRDVLTHLAASSDPAVEALASEALRTDLLSFPRWV